MESSDRDDGVHPGVVLREMLLDRGMTQADLVRATEGLMTIATVNGIVLGKRPITERSAEFLASVLHPHTPTFWLRLQVQFHQAALRRREVSG